MVIELVLFFVFAVAVGGAVVKVIEWRLDVLYGPYLAPARVEQKQHR
jgi:nitrate reductase NapE component